MAPNSVIAVLLNIGHTANHRVTVHPHGYTHDWTAYVCGAEGIDIKHFVDKVVFTLHETFTNPVQVVTKPPYKIHESGYASFGLKLDIHFANKSCRNGENVIHYEYDLYLPGDGQPSVTSFRQERLLFKTTPPDFRSRLLAGGAKETDPETLTEMAKEREKRADMPVSLPPIASEHKSEGEESRKEKKKKNKDKDKSSKHKKSKSERESSSKPVHTDPAGSLFGMSRSLDDKPVKERTSQKDVSSNSSSSSSSSSSSPANSPLNALSTNQPAKVSADALSASDSSSDSDEEDADTNTNNNSTAIKRPISSSHISSTGPKKSRNGDKVIKKSGRNSGDAATKGPNGVPLDILLDLHEKIKALDNPALLQRCVDAVEDTRQYQVTDTTFDFDLCALDAQVIHKLENYLK